ncbi:hypothetical protein AB0J35_56500 [Nonomuraea angiospora]|uniref:hypothetical protein n=1 Tax=Nonomuraea angiospora TaxID=46172 RepID=UPI003441D5EE
MLVRFARDGYWFADCPVVWRFDGIQPEISHLQLDELSIDRNSIVYRTQFHIASFQVPIYKKGRSIYQSGSVA